MSEDIKIWRHWEWLKYRGVLIFVVFMEGPIHQFKYQLIAISCTNYERKYCDHEFPRKLELWKVKSFKERQFSLRPVHTREPINPRSLPLWKNGQIGNERALIGESVCCSKIQRGLVGPALRGRGERDQFFNRLKNGRGWSRSPQVVCWAGIQRGGRRYSVGWSYFDRILSAIQCK